MPACASCRTKPSGTHSGASVTSGDAGARREDEGVVLDSGRTEMARVVHARFFRREERSFEMNAEHAGFARHAACTAASASFIFPAVSLISVGSKDVVPNRRCAAAMVRMPSSVGVVVEQHVAAAIHLDVDEAGRKPDAIGQGAR